MLRTTPPFDDAREARAIATTTYPCAQLTRPLAERPTTHRDSQLIETPPATLSQHPPGTTSDATPEPRRGARARLHGATSAVDPPPHSATGHPPPAFLKTVGRTPAPTTPPRTRRSPRPP